MFAALGRAAQAFDPLGRPERFLPTEGDHVAVLGRYLGVARKTGGPFEAAFAHVLRIREGRIARFTQVTDSRRWADALEAPARKARPATG